MVPGRAFSKHQVRQTMLAKLKQISASDRDRQSRRLAEKVTAKAYWSRARSIALFVSMRHEFQVRALVLTGLFVR